MPMRVRVNGVVAQIVQPCGKFKYGDIVDVVKLKISNFDFFRSKVCVTDGQGCYWMKIDNVKLLCSGENSI